MKKLLLAGLLGIATLGSFAATETFDFTYASLSSASLEHTGTKATGVVSAAMRIDNPSMAGMKITGIRGYINTFKKHQQHFGLAKQSAGRYVCRQVCTRYYAD